MRILFLGDIVGKPGRKAVAGVLPKWRKDHNVDLVIANAENIAHGIGVTPDTIQEARSAGVDLFTTGNHWADKPDGVPLFSAPRATLLRPANWPGAVPGVGFGIFEIGATKVALINLLGQVFIHEQCNSPFHALDTILAELRGKVQIIVVDFHAEVTSEKNAFGWYADGRVSAVIGTHTHVQTADERLLPGGTAYISDVGMCGAYDSIIGVEREGVIASFLDQLPRRHTIPETDAAQVNAVLMEINGTNGKAISIERLATRVPI